MFNVTPICIPSVRHYVLLFLSCNASLRSCIPFCPASLHSWSCTYLVLHTYILLCIMYIPFPASILVSFWSCLPPVLYLSCPALLLSCASLLSSRVPPALFSPPVLPVSFHAFIQPCLLPVLFPSCPVSLLSLIPPVLFPSCPVSLLSFIPPVLFPSGGPVFLLYFIPPVLYPSFPESLLSFIPRTL